MVVLFHILGFPVHFFGIMIALGVLAGIFVAYLEVKRKGLDLEKLFDVVLYAFIFAIIGARLFYIVFYNLDFYLKDPINVFKIYEGGLSIHGGLIGAFAFAYFYFKKHKLSFLKYADAVAPGIILGQGIGRVGCDVFGKVMNTPFFWGVQRQGQILHPAQVYEFLLDYLVFFILWRKRKNVNYDGQIFLWYVLLFSVNRGIVELFRNNPSIIGWFSISHLLSVLFIIGIIVFMRFYKKKNSLERELSMKHHAKFSERIKDAVMLLVLIGVSIFIYYWVQL